MLFNSYQFIFGFLPLTLAIFYAFGRFSRTGALRWLTLASLGFYAWWRPINVVIILPSILINFALARLLLRFSVDAKNRRASKLTLIAGIAFNVAFLGYFKYTNFLVDSANDVFGTHFILTHIVLPLGISFITFQKIAFLIQVHGKRIESFTFADYALFVLFFPQLIAGPIVHYHEVIPQFHRASCRFNATDAAVGLTMFFFGLFKKAFLADGIAPYVSLIYTRAASGGSVSVLPALLAAVGFTLQLYFDFSGYSDMAIGMARLFGVRLPVNFNSPLRSSSIIEFWQRWHMTLTRFLTSYIYNPLTLWLTRRRLARGRPALGGRNVTLDALITLLAFPTLVTMFVSGLWHGAGYTFIIWGLLHGLFLTINQSWRLIKTKYRFAQAKDTRFWNSAEFVLSFALVCLTMVFFRAPTIKSAWAILVGMVGVHGIGLPAAIFDHLGPLARLLQRTGGGAETWWGAADVLMLTAWTVPLLLIATFCPNSQQMLARYEPALGVTAAEKPRGGWLVGFTWNPTLKWATAIAALAFAAILRFAGPSEFLYWQF
jgi:alginate O-acetyltransferase complex protein AlgI